MANGFINGVFYADSVLSTTFDTNVAAAGVTLSGTTLAADGTDANIDIAINPKGTGAITSTGKSVSLTHSTDAAAGFSTTNSSNSGSARAGTYMASNSGIGRMYMHSSGYAAPYSSVLAFQGDSNVVEVAVVNENTSGTFGAYTGGAKAAGTLGLNIASTGEVTMPRQSAFMAYLSSTDTDSTGDGTVVTLVCDTEVYDRNADYNNGTGVFTAPVTGIYKFDISVCLNDIAAAHTRAYIVLTTNSYVHTFELDPHNVVSSSDRVYIKLNEDVYMAASDTATATVAVFNGTKVVDIAQSDGSPLTMRTFFAGRLCV